jgi:hypothetical protein
MRSIKFDSIGQKEVVRARPVNPRENMVSLDTPAVGSMPKPIAPSAPPAK